MGSYISSNNVLTTSSRTSTRNVNNSKKKKLNPAIDLANHFFIGGKKHDLLVLNDQNQPFLFGDKSDLNFIFLNKPAKYSYPSKTLSSATKILKCLINVRKDSLKLVKNEDDDGKFNIEFKFDSDIDVYVEIHYFVKEKLINDCLNYTKTISDSPCFKSQIYKAGTNIQFKENDHFIVPSKYDILNWQYEHQSLFPIVILLTPADKNHHPSHGHIVYASLEKNNESENYSIRLLKQKQFINGICYSLQEIYGIDKKSPQNTNIEEKEISIQISKSSNTNSNNSSRRNSDKESFKLRRDSSTDIQQQQQQGVVECVICMCEKRDTLILPCRHLCLCKSCAANLRNQSNNCPICRVPFFALLQMEISKLDQKLPTPEDTNILFIANNDSKEMSNHNKDLSNLNVYFINNNDNVIISSSEGENNYFSQISSEENLKIETIVQSPKKTDKKIIWNRNKSNKQTSSDNNDENESIKVI